MSDDTATIRHAYELFAAGNIQGLVDDTMAPNVVFHIPGKSVGGDKVGHAGVTKFLETLGERATSMELDIHDITASPEHVVAILTHYHTRGDRRLGLPAAHIWHVHDGKIMEMWELVRDTGAWDEFWA